MNVPNLAARPFLNARPVWLVTAASVVVILVMVALNAWFYVVSDRELAERIERREELAARHDELAAEVREHVRALDGVPWGSLAGRVRAANLILQEGAFSWLDLLADLEAVMPYDVRVTRVSPRVEEEMVSLSLEAVCKTRDDLLEFLQNFIDDPHFSEPRPSGEQAPEESDEPYYTLRLSVTYHPEGDADVAGGGGS